MILSVTSGELPGPSRPVCLPEICGILLGTPVDPTAQFHKRSHRASPAGLTFATYRSARLHLLTVLRSIPSASATARITKVNGSVADSTLVPIMLVVLASGAVRDHAWCAVGPARIRHSKTRTRHLDDGLFESRPTHQRPPTDHALQTNFVCGRPNPEASALGASLAAVIETATLVHCQLILWVLPSLPLRLYSAIPSTGTK